MSYQVQSGIDMPPKSGDYYFYKYPFREMKVGDSFFVPRTDVESKIVGLSAGSSSKRHSLDGQPKIVFTVRTLADKSGCRCWRIA